MSTPEKRRISALEEKRLNHYTEALKKDIDLSSGELMDKLVSAGFDIDDKDEIMNEKHRHRQIDLLLRRLRFREDGFRMLVVALRESGSPSLADLLQTDVEDFSKTTQTSPTLYRRSNHPKEASKCPSTNNEIELPSDAVNDSKSNTAATSKDSTTQNSTLKTAVYLYSPDVSQMSDENEQSNSTRVNQKAKSNLQDKSTLLYRVLQKPACLDGFCESEHHLSQLEEFLTVFKESGWYAGISDQNISVAVDQAQSQHGSYIIWYSHKYETIVVTVM